MLNDPKSQMNVTDALRASVQTHAHTHTHTHTYIYIYIYIYIRLDTRLIFRYSVSIILLHIKFTMPMG